MVSDELVAVVSHLVRRLLLLEDLEMSFRGEDVDHLGDDGRSSGELIESSLIEAESSDDVGDCEDNLRGKGKKKQRVSSAPRETTSGLQYEEDQELTSAEGSTSSSIAS